LHVPVEAENLFVRRELALYQARGVKPRHVDAATQPTRRWIGARVGVIK